MKILLTGLFALGTLAAQTPAGAAKERAIERAMQTMHEKLAAIEAQRPMFEADLEMLQPKLAAIAAAAQREAEPALEMALAKAQRQMSLLDEQRLDMKMDLNMKLDLDMLHEPPLFAMAFDPQQPAPAVAPQPPDAPAMAAAASARAAMRMRDHGTYRRGTQALDEHRYEEAIGNFDAVASRKEPKADGALYWKAYALNKLGKKQDAIAALDLLAKEYAQSPWLNDAKALRIEVQQGSGQPVSPESQTDEDLKLLAINSLMNTEQDRAMPLLEKVLNDPKAGPKVRQRALFVMAQSRSPKSRETLTAIAKGGGNPDMQMKAIEYLGNNGAKVELAQLYSSLSSPEAKIAAIDGLMNARDYEKLGEIAKAERDVKLRSAAISRLGSFRNEKIGEMLVSMYSSESEPQIKRSIVDGLYNQRNGKLLVEVARKETDRSMKIFIVERLSNMMSKSKEAADYMLELLNK